MAHALLQHLDVRFLSEYVENAADVAAPALGVCGGGGGGGVTDRELEPPSCGSSRGPAGPSPPAERREYPS